MDIKRLEHAQQAILAASQRVGSDERSSAFQAHSRVLVALYQAGQKLRRRSRRR